VILAVNYKPDEMARALAPWEQKVTLLFTLRSTLDSAYLSSPKHFQEREEHH
jgi:hypothetical protein